MEAWGMYHGDSIRVSAIRNSDDTIAKVEDYVYEHH
jgi:hypothetical protein